MSTDPIPTPEEISKIYAHDTKEFKPRGTRWRMADRRRIAQWIYKSAGGGKWLEIGCGQGDLICAASEIPGVEPFGIDLDPAPLAYAASRGLNVRQAHIDNAPFDPETFDVVIVWHVLEHLINPLEGIRSINKLLKPGGSMVACFPSIEHPKARIAGNNWHYYDPPFHLWYFTKKNYAMLCKKAGFELVRSSIFHTHAHMTSIAKKMDEA